MRWTLHPAERSEQAGSPVRPRWRWFKQRGPTGDADGRCAPISNFILPSEAKVRISGQAALALVNPRGPTGDADGRLRSAAFVFLRDPVSPRWRWLSRAGQPEMLTIAALNSIGFRLPPTQTKKLPVLANGELGTAQQ
jgi:hypothetical protein